MYFTGKTHFGRMDILCHQSEMSSQETIKKYNANKKTKKAKGSEHRVLLPLALIYVLRTNSYDSD